MTPKQAIERIREIEENYNNSLGMWKNAEYCMGAIEGILEMVA